MKIRIVRVPEGEAPEWVREAWVGLTIPAISMPRQIHDIGRAGAVSGDLEGDWSHPHWVTPQEEPLEILRQHNPGAAQWWTDHGYPQPKEWFTWRAEEAALAE